MFSVRVTRAPGWKSGVGAFDLQNSQKREPPFRTLANLGGLQTFGNNTPRPLHSRALG